VELLIIRADIACLILLLSFSIYYMLCTTKDKEQQLFLRLSRYAIGHLIFSMITVYTVNNMDIVPQVVNRICHVLFFLTGLMTHVELFKFVIRMSFSKNTYKLWKKLVYIPVIIYIIIACILPVEYCKGNGTYYSYGTIVFIAYGISMAMSLICLVTYIVRWKYISFEIKYTVVPMSAIMFIFVILQAFIPELLMTSVGLSLVCIGVFFTLDNPIELLKEQAYWDKGTKVKNRNCYEIDLSKYVERYEGLNINFGIVVADVNYLKMVNDNYGHYEGDRVIRATANLLKERLRNAEEIYRIGGDEFIAFYLDGEENILKKDIDEFYVECEKIDSLPIKLSVAIGYASRNLKTSTIKEIIDLSDQEMYKVKAKMHEVLPRSEV